MRLPVVILAGGLATRMRPETDKIPKSLLPVAGKPFIYHQLSLLRSKGIDEVVLCVGYLGEMIEDYIRNGHTFDLNIRFSYDGDTLLGTGGAVNKAVRALHTPFFILYGDSYLDVDYPAVALAYFHCGKKGLMTVFHNEGRWDRSNVIFNDGKLERYAKRERSPDMKYIDYGLGILTSDIFSTYGKTTAFDLADVYENLNNQGELYGFEVHNRFYEIGSQEGLADLECLLKGKRDI